MSLTFTPHWAFPTLFALLAGVLASLLLGGCTADVSGIDAPQEASEVCGGAVCFSPTDVAVKRWDDGELTIVAFRADDLGCEPPSSGTKTTVPSATIGGTAIELTLHAAKPGARLPVYSRDHARDQDAQTPWVTVHAVRIAKSDGRALADEETIAGEATILDLDAQTGRVRVRVDAKWSSGVSGEMLLDIEGPHACAAPAS